MGERLEKGSLKFRDIIVIAVLILGLFLVIFWKPLRLDRYSVLPSKIDWVDCIKVNDRMYFNNSFPREEVDLTEIGEELGKVKFTVSKNVDNPSYKFRNFDATYLEKGTRLYQILNTEDSIAALIEGKYYRYQNK
ncbi:MAG TPA: hypothetical protein DHW61_11320 [Lachnoclostridium phytofermentans]|uniref:Uncharacterized protein n=1 Tax=Lachnoclostridium phytofermentans TaxID=66219 RepID=A0A3D2X773_9FIRM|nr:hypothetical protein [Lachnoclostridium sp.]HCL02979.1 hypothetical protein [Lachnoclostridium phytofermentans]